MSDIEERRIATVTCEAGGWFRGRDHEWIYNTPSDPPTYVEGDGTLVWEADGRRHRDTYPALWKSIGRNGDFEAEWWRNGARVQWPHPYRLTPSKQLMFLKAGENIIAEYVDWFRCWFIMFREILGPSKYWVEDSVIPQQEMFAHLRESVDRARNGDAQALKEVQTALGDMSLGVDDMDQLQDMFTRFAVRETPSYSMESAGILRRPPGF